MVALGPRARGLVANLEKRLDGNDGRSSDASPAPRRSGFEPPRRPAPVMTTTPEPELEQTASFVGLAASPVRTTFPTSERQSSASASANSEVASGTPTTTVDPTPAPSWTSVVDMSQYPAASSAPLTTAPGAPALNLGALPSALPDMDTSAPFVKEQALPPSQTGAAVGIVLGAVAGVLGIGILFALYMLRRSRARQRPQERSPPFNDDSEKMQPPSTALGRWMRTSSQSLSVRVPRDSSPWPSLSPGGQTTSERVPSPWPFLSPRVTRQSGDERWTARTETTTRSTQSTTMGTFYRTSTPPPMPKLVVARQAVPQTVPELAMPQLAIPQLAIPQLAATQPLLPPTPLFSRLSNRWSKRSSGLTALDDEQFGTYCKLQGAADSGGSIKKATKILGRFPGRDEWKRGKVASQYYSP